MEKKLDFSIPGRETNKKDNRISVLILVISVLMIAVIVNILVSVYGLGNTNGNNISMFLPPEDQKKLALKLEKQGLNRSAADAWQAYVQTITPDNEESAKIWFRIGKLYQEENKYEKALESFYRSESFARPDDIAVDISRRIQESLEAMGKFAALRTELAERVDIDLQQNGSSRDEIVAEIGSQKISKAELDRRMEAQIESQISRFTTYLTDDQAKKQKESLLKQFSTTSHRRMFLEQYILEEILYRKARDMQLADEKAIHTRIKENERKILANAALEKEFSDKIKISDGDINNYYKAHKNDYMKPERAKIAYIKCSDKTEAKKIRQKLKKGKDFFKYAENIQTSEKQKQVSEWIENRKGVLIPGIGSSEDALGMIFSTKQGLVIEKDINTEEGLFIIQVIKREPEREMTFDEVQNDVFRDLRMQKEQEVQRQLFDELKTEYDVVIHNTVFEKHDKQ